MPSPVSLDSGPIVSPLPYFPLVLYWEMCIVIFIVGRRYDPGLIIHPQVPLSTHRSYYPPIPSCLNPLTEVHNTS